LVPGYGMLIFVSLCGSPGDVFFKWLLFYLIYVMFGAGCNPKLYLGNSTGVVGGGLVAGRSTVGSK
jgi:hypothetical protein